MATFVKGHRRGRSIIKSYVRVKAKLAHGLAHGNLKSGSVRVKRMLSYGYSLKKLIDAKANRGNRKRGGGYNITSKIEAKVMAVEKQVSWRGNKSRKITVAGYSGR